MIAYSTRAVLKCLVVEHTALISGPLEVHLSCSDLF